MNELLDAREMRLRYIHELIKSSGRPVVVIKSNTPGSNKNTKDAYVLVRLFLLELKKHIEVASSVMLDCKDGPYALLSIQVTDLISTKKMLVDIEETHELGRLIDLDLYMDATYSISRVNLSLTSRRCFMCEEDARICSRNQTHETYELLEFIHQKVIHYLKNLVVTQAKFAMEQELNLEHKFGLVTPSSSGSHPDMNYTLMQKAMHAILPFFGILFEKAYQAHDLDELFQSSRIIGMIAEEKMKEETNGINCYKGLIFILGLAIVALGYTLAEGQEFNDLFKKVAYMTRDLKQELGHSKQTFGELAFQLYGILGARGEAMKGLPSVQIALKSIESKKALTTSDLRRLLKDIFLNTEDTVMLKRSKNPEFFEQIQRTFRDHPLKTERDAINLTTFCTTHQLSLGGSADLLVTTLFLNAMKPILF
jgi:holo-ACP synthase / triphosphoribosyl-dephospho-CoA synthase